MRKICLFIIIVAFAGSASSQQNNYTVSFDGVGELKLGMSKAELEKLLKQKITLQHIGIDEIYTEDVKVKYMGKDVTLSLFRFDPAVAVLEDINFTDPAFKMVDGTGIGTEQSAIINKYENQLLIINPEWSENGRVPNSTLITLANIDNIKSAIIFRMSGKKVVSITVGPTAEFRDRE